MDRSELCEPAQRAHSNIRTAMLVLLDAALDQITGTAGIRTLSPRDLGVGEQLASGDVKLGNGVSESQATVVHHHHRDPTPDFNKLLEAFNLLPIPKDRRRKRRIEAARKLYASAFGCGTGAEVGRNEVSSSISDSSSGIAKASRVKRPARKAKGK
jgi:hypothetical protein